MDIKTMLLVALAAAALVLLSASLLAAPVRTALRAGMNAALGLLSLLLVNATSAVTGLSLGINFFNAAVVAILGVPGLGLLFLVRWVIT